MTARVAIDVDVNWFVMTDYNYQSNRYLNVSLDPVLKVDPTHVVGLRAGLREPYAPWELNVFVMNLTDEYVWAIGFDVPTVGGYAKLAILREADIDWLAQCRPGTKVKFKWAKEHL